MQIVACSVVAKLSGHYNPLDWRAHPLAITQVSSDNHARGTYITTISSI